LAYSGNGPQRVEFALLLKFRKLCIDIHIHLNAAENGLLGLHVRQIMIENLRPSSFVQRLEISRNAR
jgi:hypothetical protein